MPLETNHIDLEATIAQRAATLFAENQQRTYRRIDRMFAGLMLFQWLFAIIVAFWLSPRTWSGTTSQTHIHVWGALFLGGAITLYPVFLAWVCPGRAFTRQMIAVGQLCMSALLIHLTGGRIETHFHVFGSLAFLAFYRDWRVLLTGTLITAADHLVRGIVWPQSVYGVQTQETWRWLEHAGWVIFEDVFLIISCVWGLREVRRLCERDARLEASNTELEQKVETRTASLRTANARLEALATTDPLTGLPNHRALVDVLDKEIERSQRYGRPCSLLFLDLDHFKALNDGCGHAAGDAALRELGAILGQSLRGIDTLGRWGGEEFIALLPETEAEAALAIGECLRATVAAHLFQSGGGMYLTCSLGVATYPDNAQNRSELVANADRAMYAAKKLGRNQVRAINDPIVETLD
jgi:diguanylate cyclase (GGDEF)-like protein